MVVRLEAMVPVGAVSFLRKKKKSSGRGFCAQLLKGSPDPKVTSIPVVHARTSQELIFQREAERLDEMEAGSSSDAEPRNVSRVRRNLGLNQDDMKHLKTLSQGRGMKTMDRKRTPEEIRLLQIGMIRRNLRGASEASRASPKNLLVFLWLE
jgi:hypothetical protein